jgi:hypothetical protein
MDASIHDWLEGRGEGLILIAMIDDATSRVLARFYREATVETHMDLLGRWLRQFGRPLAVYSDRHSIFEPQDKGKAVTEGITQFGRALSELEMGLIRARSPQAKGRVERLFGTAQDRWVKEMRLKGVRTLDQANEVLGVLLPEHNRRLGKRPKDETDAHRAVGAHDLGAILSIQSERTVSNDYVVRFDSRFFQLLRPALPGLRGGKVIVEERLDGTLKIRFGGKYPPYKEIAKAVDAAGGSAPRPPEFGASAADASGGREEDPAPSEGGRAGVQPAGGRSGCTPAEPYPPDGGSSDSAKGARRPAENHPWRKPFKPQM